MNILQLSNKSPYPPKDGGSIATLSLTKSLAALGHKVTVLTMITDKHPFDIEEFPTEYKTSFTMKCVSVPARTSAPVALFNLLVSRQPYNAVRFISSDYKEDLMQVLQKEKFDIIQLEGLYLTPYIPVIRQYSKALIAMRAHNIEHEIWERIVVNEQNPLKRIYLKNLAKRIKRFELKSLNTYDLLIPITQRDADHFTAFGNNKPCHVTQTGIDVQTLQPEKDKIEFPSVFHIGALDWAPNQEGIIWFIEEIWKKIHELLPDLTFYIAGRNAPEWFKNKLNYPGIQLIGEVDDAYAFMNSKAIMVVPLKSGSGMRIKIVEGMALGKTIVSTSIGVEGIPCSHDKEIIIADTAASFIKEILQLSMDQKRFRRIGDEAHIFIVQNFDNLTITQTLVDFFQNHLR